MNRHSPTATLMRNLDEGRLQSHLASSLGLDLDEARFGAYSYFAGKSFAVGHLVGHAMT